MDKNGQRGSGRWEIGTAGTFVSGVAGSNAAHCLCRVTLATTQAVYRGVKISLWSYDLSSKHHFYDACVVLRFMGQSQITDRFIYVIYIYIHFICSPNMTANARIELDQMDQRLKWHLSESREMFSEFLDTKNQDGRLCKTRPNPSRSTDQPTFGLAAFRNSGSCHFCPCWLSWNDLKLAS